MKELIAEMEQVHGLLGQIIKNAKRGVFNDMEMKLLVAGLRIFSEFGGIAKAITDEISKAVDERIQRVKS